jgi:hypothetical protein
LDQITPKEPVQGVACGGKSGVCNDPQGDACAGFEDYRAGRVKFNEKMLIVSFSFLF